MMHDGELIVTEALAAGLVEAQFPHWSGLPLRAIQTWGSDNQLIRMGGDMVLRFPRLVPAAVAGAVEARWLPVIAPDLPLPVPELLAVGKPGLGYPCGWSILRWIEGMDAFVAPVADDVAAAEVLAGFVAALRAMPVPNGVPAMQAGGRLHDRDAFTRQMIACITDEADPASVTAIWDEALALPVWDGPPVLVHADLHPLNLLTAGGAVVAVLDWGGFCAGDPALDLICGWTVLGDTGRTRFRELLVVDDVDWARGRALAFSKAVMAAPYYRTTNPPLRDVMRATLARTIADWPT